MTLIHIKELFRLQEIGNLRLIAGQDGLERTVTEAVLFEYDPSRVQLPDFYRGDLVVTTLAYARGDTQLVTQSLLSLMRQGIEGTPTVAQWIGRKLAATGGSSAAIDGMATPADYVVVMTPGHEADLAVLRQVLPCKPAYVGCMGSRRKLDFVRRHLEADGCPQAQIQALHLPIGLEIGAETPLEIAVSVASELIAVRAARRGGRKGGVCPA